MTQLSFAAGDLVFAEGSPSTFVLRIASGKADVVKQMEGHEVPIGRLAAGDYIGEMGVILGRPRSASVRAVGDLVVERYGRDDFLELISGDSALAFRLLVRLSEHLTVLDQAFAKVSSETSAVRPVPPAKAEAPEAAHKLTLTAGNPLLAAVLPRPRIAIEHLPFSVGRQPGPGEASPPLRIDLMLDDERPYRLSRAHFRIEQGPDGYQVRDIGSVLGTQVNGVALGHHFGADSAPLRPGENEIVAGGADSRFHFLLLVEAA